MTELAPTETGNLDRYGDAALAWDRLDRAKRHGPWTARVLRLIEERPGERAAGLAESLGREKAAFKADVRKLKELGLTESLGNRLPAVSAGTAVLARRE